MQRRRDELLQLQCVSLPAVAPQTCHAGRFPLPGTTTIVAAATAASWRSHAVMPLLIIDHLLKAESTHVYGSTLGDARWPYRLLSWGLCEGYYSDCSSAVDHLHIWLKGAAGMKTLPMWTISHHSSNARNYLNSLLYIVIYQLPNPAVIS